MGTVFGIGISELLVILVITMVFVGPEKMVELAAKMGRYLAQFRQTTDSVTKEFREAFTLELNLDENGLPKSPTSASAQPKGPPSDASVRSGTSLPPPVAAATAARPASVALTAPSTGTSSAMAPTAPATPGPALPVFSSTERPTADAASPATPAPAAGTENAEGEALAPAASEPPELPALPPSVEPLDLSDILGGAFVAEEPTTSGADPKGSDRDDVRPAGVASAPEPAIEDASEALQAPEGETETVPNAAGQDDTPPDPASAPQMDQPEGDEPPAEPERPVTAETPVGNGQSTTQEDVGDDDGLSASEPEFDLGFDLGLSLTEEEEPAEALPRDSASPDHPMDKRG